MEQNRKHYLLIDGEGLLHQSFHKFAKFHSPDGHPTGAIYGFFKSLHHYFYRFSADDVYVVFDNGHSQYRKEILPTYKAHRKTNISIDYSSLQKQKLVIMKILRMLRIKYIFDKRFTCNYEGDDFLAYLTLKYLPRKSKITIITADKDFNQLLRGNTVKVFNPRKDQLIFESNCKNIFGYSARETVDYLSLVGDSSDDIPGYMGIGEKKARAFLDKYGSIQGYLDSDDYMKDDVGHEKMKAVKEKNTKLIDLKWFIEHHPIKDLPLKFYQKNTIPFGAYKKLCIKYSLSSFLDNIFIRTFKQQIERSYGQTN